MGDRRGIDAARRRFDRWAPTYEADRRSRKLLEIQAEALEALHLGSDDELLDVGCGTGAAVRRASPLVRRAVGIDLSPAMIARARELAADLPNVLFIEGESRELPFADREFTAVLCTSSLHHHPQPAVAVKEMSRVLAPGGRLVIGDPCADLPAARVVDVFLRLLESGHVRMYRSEELAAFVYGAGLGEAKVRKLWNGGYALVRAVKA